MEKKKKECSICDKVLSTNRSRIHHEFVMHGENPGGKFKEIKCPYKGCDYIGFFQYRMNEHMRTHNIDTTCIFCKRKFSKRFSMELHTWVKHSYNPYNKFRQIKCDTCKKLFKNERYFKKHVMNTNHKSPVIKTIEKKKFPCYINNCTVKLASQYKLNKHIFMRHNITVDDNFGNYICEICNFSTNEKYNIDYHRFLLHDIDNEKKFKNKSELYVI